MSHLRSHRLPLFVGVLVLIVLLFHGPIVQPTNYHDFADDRRWLGIDHAADVLSNLGFLLLGAWGIHHLRRTGQAEQAGDLACRLFCVALLLTGLGSIWYHLAPDNQRLIWDRLPIAFACAMLLAATLGRRLDVAGSRLLTSLLTLLAVATVVWWRLSDDLRPYLLLQLTPLWLIPLWLWQQRAPAAEQATFGAAVLLYVAAKLVEVYDHALFESLKVVSGHTLKHLIATIAAALIVRQAVRAHRQRHVSA
ncbi:ceramidase domain-containing protein [Chitinimonas lacunae]|uniref:Ceramidase domain-containing protein n=1 Tax=Chitinimonas lacunae TaxID=1963018 RepID=A0ABV8MPU8_9NEIS